MSVVEVRKLHVHGGKVKPYLLKDGIPWILPNLWADELALGSRSNTVEAYLRDVARMYAWGDRENILFENSFAELKGLTKSEIRRFAKNLCTTKFGSAASKTTCERRLAAIRSYIDFCFDYFIEINRVSLLEQAQAERNKRSLIKRISKQVDFASNASAHSVPSTDLTDDEVEVLDAVLHPLSDLNPFESHPLRVRNYCLFHTALETLARRGELALLEVSDLQLGFKPTVTLKLPTPQNQARRRDGASLKTLGREVPISSVLAALLDNYLHEQRDALLRPRRPTNAVFPSSRDGRRISAYTINQILDRLEAIPEIAALGKRLHPHGLRTTAANRARRKIAAAGTASGVEMTESLSYLGGWVQGSRMVQKYTKAAIHERLGEILRSKKPKPEGHESDGVE